MSEPVEITIPRAATPPQAGASDAPDAPIGRRERRKREVHERIFNVARELFSTQGFADTTVDEIADRADVAPATFFNHFQSKSALLEKMTGEVFEVLGAMTTQALGGGGSSSDKLRRFIASASQGIAANRGVARDVLLELMRNDANPDGPHPYLAKLIDPFVLLIREGQERGEMRTDYEAEFLAQMALGMMNSAITNWLTDQTYPVESGLENATDFALRTLCEAKAEETRT